MTEFRAVISDEDALREFGIDLSQLDSDVAKPAGSGATAVQHNAQQASAAARRHLNPAAAEIRTGI